MTGVALELAGLCKSFGPTRAVRGVDLEVMSGEVHALLGHNGSGKSTLIKLLAGVYQPDEGTARVGGEPLELGNAISAHRAGLRFVHQDLAVIDTLDAVENLALGVGFTRNRAGTIDWRQARTRARDLFDELGYSFDVRRPAGELLPAERTCIAIARALQVSDGPARGLVLDEPTASMPGAEVAKLFDVLRELKHRGLGIVFVTHHLDEVLEVADRVSVLRDGAKVTTLPADGLMHSDLVELLLGREGGVRTGNGRDRVVCSTGEIALEVTALRTSLVHGLDLTVRRGEIVGIAGLSGSGREDVLPALAGALLRGGSVRVCGDEIPSRRPHRAAAAGMGYVPGDRARNGVLPGLNVGDNLTLARLRAFVRGGLVQSGVETTEARRWLSKLDVRPADPRLAVLTLSGGNQQRVVVGRWLMAQPRVIVLDEPTQGVDVGARATIHRALHSAAATAAVLVASSDADELAALCDRVVVLVRGVAAAELWGNDVTDTAIDACSMGQPAPSRGARNVEGPIRDRPINPLHLRRNNAAPPTMSAALIRTEPTNCFHDDRAAVPQRRRDRKPVPIEVLSATRTSWLDFIRRIVRLGRNTQP